MKDKSNGFATREFVQNKILPEMMELANLIEPHVWWSDGDWETNPDYWGSKEFLAWLFNSRYVPEAKWLAILEAPDNNVDFSPAKEFVVTNDRWGQGAGQQHGSFFSGPDRWQPGHLIDHKWENAMTIDKKSWGIRRDLAISDVMTMEELLSQVLRV